jgi:hypothetical protein
VGDRLILYDKAGGKVLGLSDLDAIRIIVEGEKHGYDVSTIYAKLEDQGRLSMLKSETVGIYQDARSLRLETNTLSYLPCRSYNGKYESSCMQWIKVQLATGRSVWVSSSNLRINREDIRQ